MTLVPIPLGRRSLPHWRPSGGRWGSGSSADRGRGRGRGRCHAHHRRPRRSSPAGGAGGSGGVHRRSVPLTTHRRIAPPGSRRRPDRLHGLRRAGRDPRAGWPAAGGERGDARRCIEREDHARAAAGGGGTGRRRDRRLPRSRPQLRPIEAVARGVRLEWLVVLTPETLDEGLSIAGALLQGRAVDLLLIDLPALIAGREIKPRPAVSKIGPVCRHSPAAGPGRPVASARRACPSGRLPVDRPGATGPAVGGQRCRRRVGRAAPGAGPSGLDPPRPRCRRSADGGGGRPEPLRPTGAACRPPDPLRRRWAAGLTVSHLLDEPLAPPHRSPPAAGPPHPGELTPPSLAPTPPPSHHGRQHATLSPPLAASFPSASPARLRWHCPPDRPGRLFARPAVSDGTRRPRRAAVGRRRGARHEPGGLRAGHPPRDAARRGPSAVAGGVVPRP